jgi:hypothetical protein
MGDYAEARAAIETLWAGAIADAERIGGAADDRVADAETRVAEHRAEIAECGRGIGAARAMLADMGEAITQAQLDGDDAEILAIQGRHAELRALVETLEERAAAARAALSDLTGGAEPDTYLANVRAGALAEREAARYECVWRARREFEELRALLEERRAAAAGGRHPVERLNHEKEMAAGERPDAKPPHVRRADRAEEERRFNKNRARVDAVRERERAEAIARRDARAREMGLPLDRLVR